MKPNFLRLVTTSDDTETDGNRDRKGSPDESRNCTDSAPEIRKKLIIDDVEAAVRIINEARSCITGISNYAALERITFGQVKSLHFFRRMRSFDDLTQIGGRFMGVNLKPIAETAKSFRQAAKERMSKIHGRSEK